MMFVIEVAVSVIYAFATLVIGWSGVALLLCAVVGALLRLRFDRASVCFVGGIAVGVILLVDSVLIGSTIGSEMRVGVDDPDPPYLPVLVAVVAWLVHLPMGLWVLRLGTRAIEVGAVWWSRRTGRVIDFPT